MREKIAVRSSKLLLSYVTTLLALISLTVTTVAWISSTRDAVVDIISFGANGNSILAISLDGINYSSEITAEQFWEVVPRSINLLDITSDDGVVFTSIKEDQKPEKNDNYVQIPIWFRTEDPHLSSLYLSRNITNSYTYESLMSALSSPKPPTGTYVKSKGVEWTADVTFDNGGDVPVVKGTKSKYFLSNCIRLGFAETVNDTPYLNEPDVRVDFQSKIFDPSEDQSRGYGIPYGNLDYYFVKKGIRLTPPNPPLTYTRLSTFKNPYQASTQESHIGSFLLGTQEGVTYGYAKVILSIWVEGWDADCLDAVLNDQVLIQLNFQCANAV